ncbi:hypothetical protein [Mycobacterium sp.]|uniref:hypothetical protein n=1 Tax=Mycobacterium sp. TaxID=1785 RepID=UPI003BAEC6E2
MGSAQAELAGPLAGSERNAEQVAVASRIGRLASVEHPLLAALAVTSQHSNAAADFERAVDMLLAGVQSRLTGGQPLGSSTDRR